MRRMILGLVAALCCTAANCNPQAMIFLEPTAEEALTWMPIDVVLQMRRSIDPSTLVVTLNGVDITSLMTIVEDGPTLPTASLYDFWDPAVLVSGANVLEAVAENSGTPILRGRNFTLEGDPHADAVDSFQVGTSGGFGSQAAVLGAPVGSGLFQGGLDVLSLGLGGVVVVEFADNVIVDGDGDDFTVFENSFLEVTLALLTGDPFSEPGRVSVSQDGTNWFTFPCTLSQGNGPFYPGCAGVYPVLADDGDPNAPHASIPTTTPIGDLIGQDALSIDPPPGAGGDSFDLADSGLAWVRFVEIEAAGFIDGPAGANNAAFDLDAVSAIHSVPATDDNNNGVPDALE